MKAVHAVGACATIKLEYMKYSEFQNSCPKWQMHMAEGATYTTGKWHVIANGPHRYVHSKPVVHVYDVAPFALIITSFVICHFGQPF